MNQESFLQRLFGKNTPTFSASTEIIAGITTFLTMAYIIFVNPDILSAAGMDKTALIVITCLVSGIVTIVTGIFTNTPIAMAPGMGLNAFFAYTLVINQGIDWRVALFYPYRGGTEKKISRSHPWGTLKRHCRRYRYFYRLYGAAKHRTDSR